MNAWIYVAVSSDKQEESMIEQQARLVRVCTEQGWTVDEVFSDVVSGKEGVRPLLQRLIAKLEGLPKSARPAWVLMTRLDRIGRGSIIDSQIALRQIRKTGVRVWTADRGERNLDTGDDELITAVELALARKENDVRADRVRQGVARRRAAGKHVGTVPFGVVLMDGVPMPYEPEAAIVREVYERLAEGWGYGRIAKDLGARRIGKRLRDGSERPVAWSPSTIVSMLKSETVRTVVVPPELAAAADARRRIEFRSRQANRWPWPLRGAVRCTCGKLLSPQGAQKGRFAEKDYRYYQCRWHPGGSHLSHRAVDLEAEFLAILHRIVANPSHELRPLAPAPKAQKRLTQARARLTDVDRRRARVWALAEDAGIPAAALRDRLRELDEQREAARGEVERLAHVEEQARVATASVDVVSEIIAAILDRWPRMTADVQQQIAAQIASLPAIGGLWASPEYRGRLYTGAEVAKLRLCEDEIMKKWMAMI